MRVTPVREKQRSAWRPWHGAGGVAVVQGEDDDAERVVPGDLAQPVQAGGPDPVDVVLDGLASARVGSAPRVRPRPSVRTAAEAKEW
ncbi:hypothetical protein AQI88_00440 [Streptomyces cellostaticus]|uniref:Uncharacterized protein n=1 Tax=Streptomyces cellostaticus TaxID=67285 RepID=A0A101NTE6_9ACTN|nr:hypothetical protein AQI88_00440 [Streptomyces cellostaticus]GHI03456.1 hypothetical protein Scel_17770 [Streptomyces cellostaticus]